ncbi:MAG: hypothetical protein ACREDF_12330, partial [Thermoplasmata archaeon]
MPATRHDRGGQAPNAEDSPLTEPRYLFAQDAAAFASLAEAGLADCRARLDGLLVVDGPRTEEN